MSLKRRTLTQNVMQSLQSLSISNERVYELVLQSLDVREHPLLQFGVDHHREVPQLFDVLDELGARAVHLDDAVMCIDITNKADADHTQRERTKQHQTALAAGQLLRLLRLALTIHIAASAQEEDQEEEQREDQPEAGHCDDDAWRVKRVSQTSSCVVDW